MAGSKKKAAEQSPADAASAAYARRLRAQSDGVLVTGTPPRAGTSRVPPALVHCDNADIMKKNTQKKRKYLFAFPGGASLEPGVKIGELKGLDSATPTLDVEYPAGTVRFRGSLAFPRNAIMIFKGARAGTPVKVQDSFETVIVFSEWAWLGKPEDNPGEVRKEVPVEMREVDGGVWKKVGENAGQSSGKKRGADVEMADFDEGMEDEVEALSSGSLGSGDEEGFGASLNVVVPPRSNPRRARRPSMQIVDIGSDEDDADEDDEVDDDVFVGKDENDVAFVVDTGSGPSKAVVDGDEDEVMVIESTQESAPIERKTLRRSAQKRVVRDLSSDEEDNDSGSNFSL